MIFFCFHEESWDFSWWILQTPWNYAASDDLSHLGVQKWKCHRPIYPREKPLKLKYRDGSICHPIRNVCLDLKNRCLVCEPATLPINKKEKEKKKKEDAGFSTWAALKPPAIPQWEAWEGKGSDESDATGTERWWQRRRERKSYCEL